MNDNHYLSYTALLTAGLWLLAGLLLAGAWAIWVFADLPVTGVLVAETGCVFSAAAAVSQVRCYMVRLSRLVRVANGLESPDSAGLRSLR